VGFVVPTHGLGGCTDLGGSGVRLVFPGSSEAFVSLIFFFCFGLDGLAEGQVFSC